MLNIFEDGTMLKGKYSFTSTELWLIIFGPYQVLMGTSVPTWFMRPWLSLAWKVQGKSTINLPSILGEFSAFNFKTMVGIEG